MPGAFSFLPTVMPQQPDARFYDYTQQALGLPHNISGLNNSLNGHRNDSQGSAAAAAAAAAAASYAMSNPFGRDQLMQRPPFV
jgi:hypothetical protein